MSTVNKKISPPFDFHALSRDRWSDFELLFGKNGACAGCWCMYWRMKRSEYNGRKGEGTKSLMKRLVNSGEIPGIMAYHDDQPVGWLSISPRERFPALERSRILKRIDEKPVWSATCFFIAKPYRKMGLTGRLLTYAIRYAGLQGAKIIEAYPVEPKQSPMPDAFAWTGIASAFVKVGFREAARRSETRPIMRFEIGNIQQT